MRPRDRWGFEFIPGWRDGVFTAVLEVAIGCAGFSDYFGSSSASA